MVHDHGRAEDITQDVFMSALRRMRATDTSIVFKPWIYEIAKNACIDAFRRSRRAEEVSYDADDGTERLHLVSNGPTPDAAVDTRMSLDHLRGAFGGLSEAHHQILVMRELEGLSYRQIGEKLGMSRPSVESTLFRARRRLSEEYEELISGERCRRIQTIIAGATEGRVGVRDERKMARHVSYCQPCRRAALAAGFDPATLQPKRTVREKIASLLPLPGFAKRWIAGGDHGLWSAAQYAEPATSAWIKAAAAAAAVLIAGVGADAVRPHGNGSSSTPPAAVSPAPAAKTTTISAPPTTTTTGHSGGATGAHGGQSKGHGSSSGKTSGSGGSSTSGQSGSSGSSPSSSTGKSASSGGGGDDPVKRATKTVTDKLPSTSGTGVSAPQVPDVQVPDVQVPDVQVPTIPGAPPAVNGAIDTVNGAASDATGTVNGAVSDATGTVNGAVSDATGTVNNTTQTATGTVNTVTGGILGGG